jgi:TM2 domain-containing membrane protein YozV
LDKIKGKFCPICGTLIEFDADYCPSCGSRLPYLFDRKSKISKKNPTLAAALSFLITGFGQIYLGQLARGAGFFIFSIIVGVFLNLFIGQFGIYISLVFPIISAYDAYDQAKKYNSHVESYGESPW